MACFQLHIPETTIHIPANRSQQGVTYYTIHVSVGPHSWTVSHRYREFRELHERLVAEHGIAKELLPPKKVLGNRAAAFLEQRQRALELYLQQVLTGLQSAMCREFVEFLHFNRYDIVYLLQDMAQRFFLQGMPLHDVAAMSLAATTTPPQQPDSTDGSGGGADQRHPEVLQYDFSALELYAVAERLKMPCPTTAAAASNTAWKCYDFSHVVEFCTQLDGMRVVRRKPKELQWSADALTISMAANQPAATAVEPTATPTSTPSTESSSTSSATSTPSKSSSSAAAGRTIAAATITTPSSLPASITSAAAAVEPIGTSNIDAARLRLDLSAFHALTALQLDGVPPQQLAALGTLRDTLRTLTVRRTPMRRLADVLLCDSVHVEADSCGTAKRWPWLTHLDVADNAVVEVDASVRLLPRLEVLRLDDNRIETIAGGALNELPALSELSLTGNRIAECRDWHLELGNVRTLNLARNALRELSGLRKMWSLVRLNVLANRLEGVDAVDAVAALPCLEDLRLDGNPMASVVGEWGFV